MFGNCQTAALREMVAEPNEVVKTEVKRIPADYIADRAHILIDITPNVWYSRRRC